MVTSTRISLVDTELSHWLTTLSIKWTAEQTLLVHRAHQMSNRRGAAVADLLAELRMGYEVVAAALLHQAVAESTLTSEQVTEEFGPAIINLVNNVHRLDYIGDLHQPGQHPQKELEGLRGMLLAMAEDPRVVLIRLALQLVLLRELDNLPDLQRHHIAQETLDIFAPLANRLGIGRLKWELEDLAMRDLQPEVYRRLAKALDERRKDRESYVSSLAQHLEKALQKAGIIARVSGRAKHIYSIWRKMQRKRLPFERIFDVRAVRVLVDTISECYAALGIVHTQWQPIPEEFDDYIANPKGNGYQSLHTAVVGPEGKTLEVQIRTHDMHQGAELGFAAHWRYKEGHGHQPKGSGLDQRMGWIRRLLVWSGDDTDGSDLLESFREACSDRVYIVTPKGEVVDLPQGATVLDFAYYIHTQVGHRCRGAKVNGRIVPLSYVLKTGEQTHILTTKQDSPSRDWLNPHLGYLQTARARSKVRHWFAQQDQDESIDSGRTTWERELQRLGVKSVNMAAIAEKLDYSKPEDLFASIGRGQISVTQVVSRVQELILPNPSEPSLTIRRRRSARGSPPRTQGIGNLLTQIARCCQPMPPDPIAGYITRGRGVTLHRQDCANLLHLVSQHQERLMEVDWGETQVSGYAVDVVIEAYDRTGLLADITAVLVHERVDVQASATRTEPTTAIAHLAFTLTIDDVAQLSRVLAKLNQLPNVISACRWSGAPGRR